MYSQTDKEGRRNLLFSEISDHRENKSLSLKTAGSFLINKCVNRTCKNPLWVGKCLLPER